MLDFLFHTHELSEYLKNHKINMIRETESCETNYILNVSIDDYCEYLISKYRVETLFLHEKETYILKQ